MDLKQRQKVRDLLGSDDKEMRDLGHILFWKYDPIYVDFVELSTNPQKIDVNSFYRLKYKGRIFSSIHHCYVYRPDTYPKYLDLKI